MRPMQGVSLPLRPDAANAPNRIHRPHLPSTSAATEPGDANCSLVSTVQGLQLWVRASTRHMPSDRRATFAMQVRTRQMGVSRALHPPTWPFLSKGEGGAMMADMSNDATNPLDRVLSALDAANAPPDEDADAEGGGWGTARVITTTRRRRSPAMRGISLGRTSRGCRDGFHVLTLPIPSADVAPRQHICPSLTGPIAPYCVQPTPSLAVLFPAPHPNLSRTSPSVI